MPERYSTSRYFGKILPSISVSEPVTEGVLPATALAEVQQSLADYRERTDDRVSTYSIALEEGDTRIRITRTDNGDNDPTTATSEATDPHSDSWEAQALSA